MAEFPYTKLNLPKLSAQRVKRSDSSYSCSLRCPDAENRLVTVGHVRDKQEFGPIDFKHDFLEQYPQLKEITVVRKEDRSLVYLTEAAAPTKDQATKAQPTKATKAASTKTPKAASAKAASTKATSSKAKRA